MLSARRTGHFTTRRRFGTSASQAVMGLGCSSRPQGVAGVWISRRPRRVADVRYLWVVYRCGALLQPASMLRECDPSSHYGQPSHETGVAAKVVLDSLACAKHQVSARSKSSRARSCRLQSGVGGLAERLMPAKPMPGATGARRTGRARPMATAVQAIERRDRVARRGRRIGRVGAARFEPRNAASWAEAARRYGEIEAAATSR